MKKFNIRKVLDGLTAASSSSSSSSASTQPANRENDIIQENLQSEHFQLCKVGACVTVLFNAQQANNTEQSSRMLTRCQPAPQLLPPTPSLNITDTVCAYVALKKNPRCLYSCLFIFIMTRRAADVGNMVRLFTKYKSSGMFVLQCKKPPPQINNKLSKLGLD